MTDFTNPTKPDFGNKDKVEEYAVDSGYPDYDVKEKLNFHYAGDFYCYRNMVNKLGFDISVGKQPEDNSVFVRFQQQEHKGYYNDVVVKGIIFNEDGSYQLGYWYDEGQVADPSIEMMNWSNERNTDRKLNLSEFVDALVTIKDSKYGEKLDQVMSMDILINDLYLLELGALSSSANENGLFKIKVIAKKINVRSTPTTSGDNKVSTVEKGEEFTVYEIVTADGYIWYRIGDDWWIADDGTWTERID